MKRHPALSPLSREHLGALMLAQRLKQGVSSNPKYPWPEAPEAQRDKVLEMFKAELEPHFEAEERCFFTPLKPEVSEETAQLLESILDEHRQMRDLIHALKHTEQGLEKQLQAFGELLENHVRKEERDLFERLQREIPEATLKTLEAKLIARYQQRPAYRCIFTGQMKTPEI